jgi:hypothetical protein
MPTIFEAAAKIKEAAPKLRDLSDTEAVRQYLEVHPEQRSKISDIDTLDAPKQTDYNKMADEAIAVGQNAYKKDNGEEQKQKNTQSFLGGLIGITKKQPETTIWDKVFGVKDGNWKDAVSDQMQGVKALPWLLGGGAAKLGLSTAGSNIIADLSKGKSAKEAVPEGILGGATAAIISKLAPILTRLGAKGAKKVLKPIGDVAKETWAKTGSTLVQDISKEQYRTAIDREMAGNSVFNIPKNQYTEKTKEIGSDFMNVLKKIKDDSGKYVGSEKGVVKSSKEVPRFEPKKSLDTLKSEISKTFDSDNKISSLSPIQQDRLNDLKYELSQKGLSADGANLIKQRINQGVFSKDRSGKYPITDPMGDYDRILSNVAHDIGEQVNKKLPDLGAANQEFSYIKGAVDNALEGIPNKDPGKTILSEFNKGNQIKDNLKVLSNYDDSAKNLYNNIDDQNIRENFSSILPRLLEPTNIARIAGLGGLGVYKQPFLMGALATSYSPAMNKAGIRAVGGVNSAIKTSLPLLNQSFQYLAPRLAPHGAAASDNGQFTKDIINEKMREMAAKGKVKNQERQVAY